MIKLIVTNLDGTLLTSDKQLPPDFDAVMHRLQEMLGVTEAICEFVL